MMWYRHRKKKTWPIIWIFLGISAYTWHFHAFSLIWTTNCGYMTPDDGIAPSIEPSAHGLSKLSRRIPEKKNTGFFLYSVHKSRNGICIDGAIRYSQTGCVARQTRWRNSVIWAMHFATGVYIYIYTDCPICRFHQLSFMPSRSDSHPLCPSRGCHWHLLSPWLAPWPLLFLASIGWFRSPRELWIMALRPILP